MRAVKIVHIVPGSGGTFYCENCLRDVGLVKALRALGHEVIVAPMYLPLFLDDPELTEDTPVFFGGVNVYLQQTFSFFRKTPRWLDRVFDSQWVLERAAQKAGSTRADGLGAMTLSMLQGREGRQRKELNRLVEWLVTDVQPDLVHISNALLLGLAAPIRAALGKPVVCSLQDEDSWLDALDPPYDAQCWQLIREQARAVDAFVTVSRYYQGLMMDRLRLSAEDLRVIPIGIETHNGPSASLTVTPPVVGFLSKLSEPLGLDILAAAVLELKHSPTLSSLKLRATGGLTADDRPFVAAIRKQFADAGFPADFEIQEDFSLPARRRFLASLSVLSVPMRRGEAFGVYILEALASGVPVVQPALGAFPELLAETGGGVCYEPNTPAALAAALAPLLESTDRRRQLGQAGQAAVRNNFSIDGVATRMAEFYQSLTEAPKG